MLKKVILLTGLCGKVRANRGAPKKQQALKGVRVPGVPLLASHDQSRQEVVSTASQTSKEAQSASGTAVRQGTKLVIPRTHESYSRKNPPPYDSICKFPEYWEFVYWSAIHPVKREPKTMEMLADKFGILRVRLSEWKYMPEYHRDVDAATQEAISGEPYATAVQAWLIKIGADPTVRDIQYLNQWKGVFNPTKRYSGKVTIAPGQPRERMDPPPKVETTQSTVGRKLYL